MVYITNGEFKVYEGDSWKKEIFSIRPYCFDNLYPRCKFSGYKYFEDFTYNGEKYYLNTIVKLSDDAKRFLGAESLYSQVIQHEITNVNKERWGYVVRKQSNKIWHVFTTVPPDQLIEEIVTPAAEKKEPKQQEYFKDNQVPEVIQMWVYYILAMCVSIIFNDRIMLWVIFSVLFFAYREEKLKKPPRHNYDVK